MATYSTEIEKLNFQLQSTIRDVCIGEAECRAIARPSPTSKEVN